MDELLRALEEAGAFSGDYGDPAGLREVIAYHRANGIGAHEIHRSVLGDYVSAVGFERLLTVGEMSASAIAAATGRTVDDIVDVFRLLGVEIDDPDHPHFLAEEAAIVGQMSEVADAFDEGEADDILRATASALTLIAETIVASFVGGIEERLVRDDVSLLERTKLTESMGPMGVDFGLGIGSLFRHHLRAAIERQRASMSQRDRHLRHMAIGFVDLVGFTPLSSTLGTHDLLELVRDFERRAFDVTTRHGGRIVKHIGDEVMVASSSAEKTCLILLTLIDEFGAGSTSPRAGVAYGEVLTRQGDFYGPVVNLAARLVDEAVPGELLASAAVADSCPSEVLRFEAAGRRMCKGFAEPVSVVTVTVVSEP